MNRKFIIPEANLPANYKKLRRSRIGAAIMAGVLSLSLTVPAFATDVTVDGVGVSYTAYQLMNLTTSLKKDPSNDSQDVNSHPLVGGEHDPSCYNYAYTVNEAFRSVLQSAVAEVDEAATDAGDITDAAILKFLSELDETDDAETIRKFADHVYGKIKEGHFDSVSSTGATFTGLDQGYWLIVESGDVATGDSRSLVMLDTKGQDNITVKTKEGAPTLEKKVKEGEAWQDYADVQREDNATFQLTAKLNDALMKTLDEYTKYKMVFHDKLAEGLSFNNDETLKVTVYPNGVEGGSPVVLSKDTDFTVSAPGSDDCSIDITIDDLLTLADVDHKNFTISKDTVVVVEYTAKLTGDKIVYGNDGNDNTAHLEYSNDPYISTETGVTTDDTVTVFSFSLRVDKVDENQKPLRGAGFKLQKKGADDAFKDVDTISDWDIEGNAESGPTTFTFKGLEAGEYQIVETQVPDGYAQADPIPFKVEPVYETDGTGEHTVKELKVTINGKDAVVKGSPNPENGEIFNVTLKLSDDGANLSTTIENVPGTKLPSTGGTGAFAVYAGSAAAVGGAALLIVMRKKKEQAQD